MNHQAPKHQVIQIFVTVTLDEGLTMDDINALMDQIVHLIRNSLRKSLRARHKIRIQPAIVEVVSLPLKKSFNTCS